MKLDLVFTEKIETSALSWERRKHEIIIHIDFVHYM